MSEEQKEFFIKRYNVAQESELNDRQGNRYCLMLPYFGEVFVMAESNYHRVKESTYRHLMMPVYQNAPDDVLDYLFNVWIDWLKENK